LKSKRWKKARHNPCQFVRKATSAVQLEGPRYPVWDSFWTSILFLSVPLLSYNVSYFNVLRYKKRAFIFDSLDIPSGFST